MNCPARGQRGQGNFVIDSRQKARYQCTPCKKTFPATTGTPFYWLHHPVVAWCWWSPTTIVAANQLDERTVLDFPGAASHQAQRLRTPVRTLVQQSRDYYRAKVLFYS
jgi:hypothetical protein